MVHLAPRHDTGTAIQNWINTQKDENGDYQFRYHSTTIWTISSAEQLKQVGPVFRRAAQSYIDEHGIDWTQNKLVVAERDEVDRRREDIC